MASGPSRRDTQRDPKKERLSDDAFHRILEMIFQGVLSPGTRLPAERELSEQLGISRTTLRDAMNRLEASGFVQRRPKSGTYVCTAVPQSLQNSMEHVVDAKLVRFRDIIGIRRVLEVWAVQRAAEEPAADAITELKECVDTIRATAAFETPEQIERFSEADLRFHQVIAEMTGNPLYVHLFHFLFSLILRSISLSRQIVPGNYAQQNLAVHQRIYEALRAADPEAARAAMEEHFDFVEQHLLHSDRSADRSSKAKRGGGPALS